MALTNVNRRKVKKVVKGLNKASKLHAKQAKTLKGIIRNGSKKVAKKS
jgi:hypothetical protein|tara:strand:- start:80 stop:223 length:144 start_codon:yes stop_codon:yes gene_type:complete